MKLLPAFSFLAAALLMALLLSACSRNEGPMLEVGKVCTIQFRRDALGAAASNPVPPMTHSYNGADTNVQGKIKRVTNEWVVIEQDAGEIWIPKAVILLIKQ